MYLRKQLAAIFSPTLRLAAAEHATVIRGGFLGETQWVVPRASLHYRRIDLGALPAKRRAGAAAIAARRDAAGPARFHIAWKGAVAHVWTWPDAESGAAGIDANEAWIPETLLRTPPTADELRLVRQVGGFEGQFWRTGDLHASQWWPEVPGTESWQRFVRACGIPGTATVPEPEDVPWSGPWADGKRAMPASPAMLERWAWQAVAVTVALALGWQLAAEVRWRFAQSELDARMTELRSKATPLLAAREGAERARESMAGLQQLQQATNDYRLVSLVIAPLPTDTRLVEWQREGDKLRVALHSSDVDPRHFVSAYDSDPRLRSVVATPGEAGITMLDFDLAVRDEVR